VSEQELMQSIKSTWGKEIAGACDGTDVPAPFVAALIAGESGGFNNAKRFEKNVLAALWEVLLGRKAAYGSIGRADLVSYVSGVPGVPVTAPSSLPADAFQRVDVLATSWGLTQIMGYHCIEAVGEELPGANVVHLMDSPSKTLTDPETALAMTVRMLKAFAAEFHLSLATDHDKLFHCWNTGSPTGQTFDPNYAANGIRRMGIYESIP
jgi:hypothetical protein